MAKMYLTNTKVLADAPVAIEGVTNVSIGRNLVYVQYMEDGKDRVRAYGRDEFIYFVVDKGEDDGIVVDLANLVRAEFHFDRPTTAAEDFAE